MGDLLDEGIIFFNCGRFFEAHEAWEDLWRQESGGRKLFYQGLVQAAVALHHLSKSNRVGAQAQLEKSISKLDQYASDEAGLDVVRLRRELRQVLERLEVAATAEVRIVRLKRDLDVVESGGTG